MQRNLHIIIVLFLFCFIVPNHTFSQDSESVQSLSGIDTLQVIVPEISSDLEQAGLSRLQIQTDVEIKLRRVGFKIKTEREQFTPEIYLTVIVGSKNNVKNGIFAISVTTSLHQKVILERNKSINIFSSTWETKNIGTVGKENVRDLSSSISSQVDEFISDWLKANPSAKNLTLKQQPQNTSPPQAQKKDDSPFTATYVGGNSPPTVEVFNDTDRTMYFDFGQGIMTAYTIPSQTSQKITLSEGLYNYKASAPRVRSKEGEAMFKKGYVYSWRFFIVTVPR